MQIDEKYTCRAAKMYRAQLQRSVSGKADEEDDIGPATTGSSLRPLRTSGDDGSGSSTRGSPPSASPVPLASEWLTPAQAKAAAAAVAAAEAQAQAPQLIAIGPSTPAALSVPANLNAAAVRSGSGVTVMSSAASGAAAAPGADALDVSAVLGSNTTATAGAAKRPAVIASSSLSSGSSSKLGATKLGAKKLGAAKLGGSGSSTSFDDFEPGSTEAPKPAVALSTQVGTARDEAALASALGQLQVGPGSKSFVSSYGGSSGTASGDKGSNASIDKYKNAKAISSDMLFTTQTEEEKREERSRLANLSGARAISSDQFFNRDRGDSSEMGMGMNGRYTGRVGSTASDGLGEFVEKFAVSAADDLRKVGDVAKNFAESFLRR
jgi:hypothetical protein